MKITDKVNCGGQGCPERKNCRRYAERTVDHYESVVVDDHETRYPVLAWASFDIERKIFGSCPHKLWSLRHSL